MAIIIKEITIKTNWDNYWMNQVEKSTDRILKKYNDDSFY